jgi:hypothetical protein
MTAQARTYLTADDIALKFCTRKDGTLTTNRSWWLSLKQTQWLMRAFAGDVSHSAQGDPRRKLPGNLAVGRMANGADWSCRVSPVNGCGCFAVGKDAETITTEYRDERAAKAAELRTVIARYEETIAALATCDEASAREWERLVTPALERARRELAEIE